MIYPYLEENSPPKPVCSETYILHKYYSTEDVYQMIEKSLMSYVPCATTEDRAQKLLLDTGPLLHTDRDGALAELVEHASE